MHVTIVGAGAIGGTVGAYLIRAGHEVLFVDVAEAHVEAINSNGLTITGREEFTLSARAVTPDRLKEPLGLTFLCVKAQHTEDALTGIEHAMGDETVIVSLQNGLNEHTIANRIGRDRTIGAFINFGADYHGPGLIMYGGQGAFVVGELDGAESERVNSLVEAIQDAFMPTAIATGNIWGYLWGKLGYGAQLFATALADETIGAVFALHELRPMLANLAGESVAVAEAEGIEPMGFDGYSPDLYRFGDRDWAAIHASFDRIVEFNRASKKKKSGIWRDLAVRKRKTEVDVQIAPISSYGRKHDIKTPLVDHLVARIHDIEEGAPMSLRYLIELRDINEREYGREGLSDVM